jgi:non-lysosomal glucosylceramidase
MPPDPPLDPALPPDAQLPPRSACATGSGCCPSSPLDRREFVRLAGFSIGAATASTALRPLLAGPFEDSAYSRTIPADKKLAISWIESLFARGRKQTYSDPEALTRIGMPIGGFFAGTVYLAGDGRLWLWDVFNRDQTGILPREAKLPEGIGVGGTSNMQGLNYLSPAPLTQPFTVGFTLSYNGQERSCDSTGSGFRNVTFDGRYPLGRVTYRDPDCPLEVQLEAFSPFIPLNLADSSLPATIMEFRLRNAGEVPVEAVLSGQMENPVCLFSRGEAAGSLINRIIRRDHFVGLDCSAAPPPAAPTETLRADIVFENFEQADYGNWTVEGTAFGLGPVSRDAIPDYQGDLGGSGQRVVNSHASAPGIDVRARDGAEGTLTSPIFRIERRFISFLIGGGEHRGGTCLQVIVDGKVVASATGRNENRLAPASLNVQQYEGQQAKLQIVDAVSGAWGNIGVDQIIFTDRPPAEKPLVEHGDFGTMTLALLNDHGDEEAKALATADVTAATETDSAVLPLSQPPTGRVGRRVSLAPGEQCAVTFVIAWHFPNLYCRGVGNAQVGNAYAVRFDSAVSTASYVAEHYPRLAGDTRRWVETWYDSTLPYWLLDRAMANTSTLATTTCYRFADGRFWAWEGIGCCEGTCTHVWHYAQAPGRLFPELERLERERVNFGIGLHEDGAIGMRTNLRGSNQHADDGQCGRILGVLREHQMSANSDFLQRIWPNVRRAIDFMIRRDANSDGVLEGAQPNTLDAEWYGKISFISSLYLAMLRAGETLANAVGDAPFARRCAEIASRGAQSILETYNGEYFVQIEDPQHRDQIGVGNGCYIDQVFGQTWAHWVGLGSLFDRPKQLSALRALWKYNFVPNVGPFRKQFTPGRWYAAEGDAGLIMCSWPHGDKNPAFANHWQYGYFNECMTGFEYQVAAHMVWEGIDQPDLLLHGLAVARAIHDRYDAALRNPYNEIECSDHYSRAMASYGVFQAACGFQCNGPKGLLEYVPRLSPEKFRAPFTAAEGWGSIGQETHDGKQLQTIAIRWGKLHLAELVVQLVHEIVDPTAEVFLGNQQLAASVSVKGRRLCVLLNKPVEVVAGQELRVQIAASRT